ncbi:MAG: PepSY-associated TM helix domain-containing protein [Bacteroidota bacterium]
MKLKGLSNRLYSIFFDTHTVAGITISAILFIIFYAGAFSLFRHEISQWENPSLRGMEATELAVAPTLAALHEAEPDFIETSRLTIRPGHSPYPEGMVYGERTVTDSTTAFFQASVLVDADGNYTITPREENPVTIGNTLYQLHYLGQIPYIGLYLAGLTALFFLFASVTGVLIHWRNIVTKFYAFSTRPSWKQIWTNAHTVLGMIGLPFQVLYAITGAFYGILILLLIPSALILFGGDTQKVQAAVRPSAVMTFSDSAAVVDFSKSDLLIAQTKARLPDLRLRNIRFQNYGREDGILSLFFDDDKTMTGTAEVTYRVHTEEIIFESGPHKPDYVSSVLGTIGRLHFATYGGLGLKVIYFILSMLTCFMLISGVLLWQAARDKRSYSDRERQFHHRVTKTNLAVCLGLIPAVALIFLLNKLIPMEISGRPGYVEGAFFLGWLLLVLVGLRWDNYRRMNRNYLICGGFFSLAIPLANDYITHT